MIPQVRLGTLRDAMLLDLRANVLPFWLERVLDEERGFFGYLSEEAVADPEAPLGAVLCSRLLWSFSAAFARGGDPRHGRAAARLFAFLERRFVDHEHGGVFWMLDHRGRPLSDRKQTYAVAFAVYALAEHHRATGSDAALRRALSLSADLEAHAADPVAGGYFEARARDWSELADVRLSEKDRNAPKSMNTHLHVMEAYAGLLRSAPDPALQQRLQAVVAVHLERILDAGGAHLRLFFDRDFAPIGTAVSYGHDIEASWLLVEAAEVAGDAGTLARAREAALRLARATLVEGLDPQHGGVFAERHDDGRLDDEKHWWMQAEAVVGFLNAYQLSREEAFLAAAESCWSFIDRFLVDRRHGEWRWRVRRDGAPIPGLPKVEPWKCPYHNSRAALEVDAMVAGELRS